MIEKVIGKQQFELILDQIGIILRSEIDNQYVLNPDADFLDKNGNLLSIYKERDIPIDNSETPIINVMFEKGTFDMRTSIQHDGVYRYIIEVVSSGETKGSVMGDTTSMLRVQKIIGKCRAIIMNPEYITMGFPRGSIKRRYVEEIAFGKPIRQDSSHMCIGRLVMCVEVVESSPINDQLVATTSSTSVKIELSNSGYVFVNYTYI